MSRSEFTCYSCRHKLANIKHPSEPGSRILRATHGTDIGVADDNRILLTCGTCGKVNQFTWRTKPVTDLETDRLAGNTQR